MDPHPMQMVIVVCLPSDPADLRNKSPGMSISVFSIDSVLENPNQYTTQCILPQIVMDKGKN